VAMPSRGPRPQGSGLRAGQGLRPATALSPWASRACQHACSIAR
jgi:hypothetical protein